MVPDRLSESPGPGLSRSTPTGPKSRLRTYYNIRNYLLVSYKLSLAVTTDLRIVLEPVLFAGGLHKQLFLWRTCKTFSATMYGVLFLVFLKVSLISGQEALNKRIVLSPMSFRAFLCCKWLSCRSLCVGFSHLGHCHAVYGTYTSKIGVLNLNGMLSRIAGFVCAHQLVLPLTDRVVVS
jgi:hypothetical protein